MKMKTLVATLMALLLLIPAALLASEHGMMMDHDKKEMPMEHGKSMDMEHGKSMDMEHGKMEMPGMDMSNMMMLDSEEDGGVKAMFHLNDVSAEMAKAGQPFTHHLMVNFVDSKSGKAIEDGKVAVKVKSPDGKVSDAKMMMGMQGHFGVDLVLDQKGEYEFDIACKVKDGEKREFHPHHMMK